GERALVRLAHRCRGIHGVERGAHVTEAVEVADLVGGDVLKVVLRHTFVTAVALARGLEEGNVRAEGDVALVLAGAPVPRVRHSEVVAAQAGEHDLVGVIGRGAGRRTVGSHADAGGVGIGCLPGVERRLQGRRGTTDG